MIIKYFCYIFSVSWGFLVVSFLLMLIINRVLFVGMYKFGEIMKDIILVNYKV